MSENKFARTILHCDCNSFFASVEIAENPSLRGYPVAVCGSQDDRRGIVLAKSEEAKRYGVVYCVLKGRGKEKDGMADILVRAEDASRINRIVERFRLNSPQNPQQARTGASPSAPMSGQPIGKRPSLREQIRKAKDKSASRILTEQER